MPIIIKNGKVYGDRSVTLSQAEYNALSEVEKNNGTTYYIYDVNGVVTADDVALDGGTVETLAGSVATIESSPAVATHAVGDHILWNGQLYTVTAAIAVGETLTVGTNITSTNVGSELTALNAGLPLLWTNPNPGASFAQQTITIDLNDYKAVIVVFRVRTDGLWGRVSSFAVLGYESIAIASIWDGAQWTLGRLFTPSNNSVVFGSGRNITNNGTEDNRMIPEFVYGIK